MRYTTAMTDTTLIFKITASILVPEAGNPYPSTFIYSAKKTVGFYEGLSNNFHPLYGKFDIVNDNIAGDYYIPPYHIG